MYVSLRKVRLAEDLEKMKVVAQLEGEEIGIKVKVTVEAEDIHALKEVVEDLGKGAMYEMQLKAIKSKNTGLGQFFRIFEEVEA